MRSPAGRRAASAARSPPRDPRRVEHDVDAVDASLLAEEPLRREDVGDEEILSRGARDAGERERAVRRSRSVRGTPPATTRSVDPDASRCRRANASGTKTTSREPAMLERRRASEARRAPSRAPRSRRRGPRRAGPTISPDAVVEDGDAGRPPARTSPIPTGTTRARSDSTGTPPTPVTVKSLRPATERRRFAERLA